MAQPVASMLSPETSQRSVGRDGSPHYSQLLPGSPDFTSSATDPHPKLSAGGSFKAYQPTAALKDAIELDLSTAIVEGRDVRAAFTSKADDGSADDATAI